MKGVLRYLAALMAVLLMMCAAAGGVLCWLTTSSFWTLVNAPQLESQQARIDEAAASLTQTWHISGDVLVSCAQGAAARQAEAAADWWHALWHDGEAAFDMPPFLDAAQERELVNAIMADEGFRAATDEAQRRAVARDEIAYALDEAVCGAVTPLRGSLVALAVSLLSEKMALPALREIVMVASALALAAGAVLLALAHRAAGSGLAVTGLMMALLALLVWLMDLPGMLAQLSPIAAAQGQRALLLLALPWFAVAALLLAAGVVIICVKCKRGGEA